MKKSDHDFQVPEKTAEDIPAPVPEPVRETPTHPVLQLQRRIGNQAVQEMVSSSNADSKTNSAGVHETADQGMTGSAQPLPHLDKIQQAFGKHDVSGLQAYVGGSAAQANEQLGAAAYAVGDSVAFKHPPDLHTAAHETAHVVQQRIGIQLPGDVGTPGDTYEQQADAAADAVVQGRSVESMFAGGANQAADSHQVQFDDLRSERYQGLQQGQPAPSGGGPGAGPADVGSVNLPDGIMKWSLVPIGGGAHGGAVNARIEFIPNAAVASASKNISFIQTVSTIDTHRSGVSGFFGFGSTTATNPEVDKGEGDTDPFYGAQWNRGASRWGDEPQSVQARFGDRSGQGLAREGSRPFNASNPSAVLNDTPMLQVNEAKDFETVAVVLETGRVLGSLRWNIQCWSAGFFNDSSSTIVRRAECVADPSSGFESVANSFFTSAGSVVLEGFEPGLADLRPSHPQLLSTVVSNLQRWPSAKAVVGGAATQDEPNPQALSQKRGENVRAYLVAAGVPESRIELEFYGSDWARALVTGGGAGFMNRRVQIRIT